MTLVSKEHVSSCNKEEASAGSQNVIKLGSEVRIPQVLQSERFTQLVICKNFGHLCGLTPDDHFSELI